MASPPILNTSADNDAAPSSSSNKIPIDMQLQLKNSNYVVKCKSAEGDIIPVRASVLRQCGLFVHLWTSLDMPSASQEELDAFMLPLGDVSTKTFEKVLAWMLEHENTDKKTFEIVTDPGTHDRKWFDLTQFQKNFFKVNMVEMSELLTAAHFLDIQSMYNIGTQSMAAIIRDRTPQELVELLGLENNMTEEEVEERNRRNVWALY